MRAMHMQNAVRTIGKRRVVAIGLWALSMLCCASGCGYMNTQLILNQMNSTASCPAPARATTKDRAARIVFASLADAYFDKDAVGKWLDAAIANPAPIMSLYAWTAAHPHPSSSGGCPSGPPSTGLCSKNGFADFNTAVLPQTLRKSDGTFETPTSIWGLPAPAVCLQKPTSSPVVPSPSSSAPPPKLDRKPAALIAPTPPPATLPPGACSGESPSPAPPGAWRVSLIASPSAIPAMVDAERFVANLESVPPSLVTLRNIADPTPCDDEIRAGVIEGLAHAKRYITQRHWARTLDRPRTALVLSGGGGTGAFQAGFVNRLLGVLQACNSGPGNNCNGASVDLVVGTSTGSLVGFLVDMFSNPDPKLQNRARSLLREEYTCSVENDLYCQVSAPITRIATNVPGLVQFDGIESLLAKNWSPELTSNATELVTMTVDYESGDLFAESDQDPDDAMTPQGRVESVLASIVEPLMAYPVRAIHRANGVVVKGTFIDGGIRSGLPVLEAMRRGAERVVAISTASIDPDPINRPSDVVSIVLRTIDLLVDQPRVGEVQQADLAATARRMSEYNLCRRRYQVRALEGASVLADEVEIENFCRRTNLPSTRPHTQGAAGGWLTPGTLAQIATSWQSAWVFRPEKPIQGMSGYSFDPIGMRKLYLEGVDAFQARCREILDLFGIPEDVSAKECSRTNKDVEEEERKLFSDEAACEAKTTLPRRTCPSL